MELSTQGLVTDGVGKLSSSLHSPVGPSQESLPLCLCLSVSLLLSLQHLLSMSLIRNAPVSHLLAPSFVSVVETSEISFPPCSSCVFGKTGKVDDISRMISRLMQ